MATGNVEVHVKHQLPQYDKAVRFVSRDVAETMVREGRAVWPGDPKTPSVYEDGKQ